MRVFAATKDPWSASNSMFGPYPRRAFVALRLRLQPTTALFEPEWIKSTLLKVLCVKSVTLLLNRALLLTVKSANVPLVPEVPPLRLVIVAVVTLRLLMPPYTAPIKSTPIMSLLFMFSVPDKEVVPAVSEPAVKEPAVKDPAIKDPVDRRRVLILSVLKTPVVKEPVDRRRVLRLSVLKAPVVKEPVDRRRVLILFVLKTPVVKEPVDRRRVLILSVLKAPVVNDPVDRRRVLILFVLKTPVVNDPVDRLNVLIPSAVIISARRVLNVDIRGV